MLYNHYIKAKSLQFTYLGIQFDGVLSTSHDENNFIGTGFACWLEFVDEFCWAVADRLSLSAILRLFLFINGQKSKTSKEFRFCNLPAMKRGREFLGLIPFNLKLNKK